MKLSENEKVAKQFMLNLIVNGLSELCDSKFNNEMFKLPDFYDEKKFKRGQKYFTDNSFQILATGIYGMLNLVCDPFIAKVLDNTGYTSTQMTARKRYTETTLHFDTWFTDELKPSSRSWESIKRVRKMHLAVSNQTLKRDGYGITQTHMVSTLYVFTGYIMSKPHLLGIKYDCDEDREGFVHMWAVFASMLGIKDEFNMCLQPLSAVESICHIFTRYHFIPFLQIETTTFEKLARAFTEGLKVYLPYQTYKSRLFLARRLAGIPGYQYAINQSKEVYSRQIFTKDELKSIKAAFKNAKGFENHSKIVFREKIPLINLIEFEDRAKLSKASKLSEFESIYNLLELNSSEELEVIEIVDNDLENHFNDDKFYQLSKYDQFLVKFIINFECTQNPIIRKITGFVMTAILTIMRIFFK